MNLDEIILELKKRIQELEKYERFVNHVYSHSDEIDDGKGLCLEDWVMCKICNKTFKQIVNGD